MESKLMNDLKEISNKIDSKIKYLLELKENLETANIDTDNAVFTVDDIDSKTQKLRKLKEDLAEYMLNVDFFEKKIEEGKATNNKKLENVAKIQLNTIKSELVDKYSEFGLEAEMDEIEEEVVEEQTETITEETVEEFEKNTQEELAEEVNEALDNSSDEERVETKRKPAKVIGTVALIALLCTALGISINSCNKRTKKGNGNTPSVTSGLVVRGNTPSPTISPIPTPSNAPVNTPTETVTPTNTATPTVAPTNTPTEAIKEGFFDINDNEQVEKRANEIVASIKKENPDFIITTNEVVNIMKLLNGGKVENFDEQSFNNITRIFLDLNNNTTTDYSKFVIDGSRSQMMFETIYKVQTMVAKNQGTEKANESADVILEALMKSVYEKENRETDTLGNVVHVNTLETSTARFYAVSALMASYAKNDNVRDGIYLDNNGNTYFLSNIAKALNEECRYDVMLDGKQQTLDYLSALYFESLDENYEKSLGYSYRKTLR